MKQPDSSIDKHQIVVHLIEEFIILGKEARLIKLPHKYSILQLKVFLI